MKRLIHLGTVAGILSGNIDWLKVDDRFGPGDVHGILRKSTWIRAMDVIWLIVNEA